MGRPGGLPLDWHPEGQKQWAGRTSMGAPQCTSLCGTHRGTGLGLGNWRGRPAGRPGRELANVARLSIGPLVWRPPKWPMGRDPVAHSSCGASAGQRADWGDWGD